MQSTEELVRAAQAGETPAFAELVRRYERAAIVTARAVLGDFHSAQDAAQEAFVTSYEKLNQLRDAESFGPWLLQIVRRRAQRMQNQRRAEPEATTGLDPADGPASDWMEPYGEVIQKLACLPEHERIVVVMRYVEGRSINDIAVATGAPVGTITKQLSRAIKRLREWFVEAKL